jgi:plastocyanin
MRRLSGWLTALMLMGMALVAGSAQAAEAPTEIALSIDQHEFQPNEIKVKAGTSFVLVITNRDTSAEEFESRELRIEKIIPAAKTVRVRMPALKAGTYTFIGEYHAMTAQGRIVAE